MSFVPPHLLDNTRWRGMRVGLLGGSFNPPHAGHLHISEIALYTLKLDFVWWLVTPQNPLKAKAELDFTQRLALSRSFVSHPHILVTGLETELGTNLTWKTIKGLKRHFPATDFIWLSGMDNALTMHRWNNWKSILSDVPTAHIARLPARALIERCPLKLLATQHHHYLDRPEKVPLEPHHTYWLLQKRMVGISSTEIRNALFWQ